MLGQEVLLIFLIGSTVGSCHVIKYKLSEEHEQPMSETAELTPFIAHFLPRTSNFFYKPKFYISSPITKIIEKDCQQIEVSHHFRPDVPDQIFFQQPEDNILNNFPEHHHFGILETPKPVETEPCITDQIVEIPEAPILPPFSMPELPEPIIVETEHSAPESNSIDYIPGAPIHTFIPDRPDSVIIETIPPPVHVTPDCQDEGSVHIPEPLISVNIHQEHKPIQIPPAPELPPLIMPELPSVNVEGILAVPDFQPQLPGIEIIHDIQIPPAPELPPFIMPELPELPEAHVSVNINHEHKPIEIPQAPELPPLIMPELPSSVNVDGNLLFPCKPEHPGLEIGSQISVDLNNDHKPIEIPQAPELPPFIMPELPSSVNVGGILDLPNLIPALPGLGIGADVSVDLNNDHKPIEIPQAPELPPFIMPEFPLSVNVGGNLELPNLIPELPGLGIGADVSVDLNNDHKPVEIPQAPELPPFIMPEFPWSVNVGGNLELPNLIPALPGLGIGADVSVDLNNDHKPIEIPQAPELPPLIMPEFPLSVNVGGSLELPNLIPELPGLGIGADVSVDLNNDHKPVEIPQAPELPPFIMPEFPLSVNVGGNLELPNLIPALPGLGIGADVSVDLNNDQKPVEIPQAPELPPFIMPEFPLSVNVGGNLDLPNLIPALPGLGIGADVSVDLNNDHKPIEIPQAPELPPFIMPEFPLSVNVGGNLDLPNLITALPGLGIGADVSVDLNNDHKPIEIPQAPELPPFIIHETIPQHPEPIHLNVPEPPKAPECENEEHNETVDIHLGPIPEAPVLPPFTIEPLPEHQPQHQEYPHWTQVQEYTPEGPILGGISSQIAVSFPNYCAHTIVLERVLPNMASNRVDYPVFQYPAPTPYYTQVY